MGRAKLVEGVEADEFVTEGQGQQNWEDRGTDTESDNESNWTEDTKGSGEVSELAEEEGCIIGHQPERGIKRRYSEISDGEESN